MTIPTLHTIHPDQAPTPRYGGRGGGANGSREGRDRFRIVAPFPPAPPMVRDALRDLATVQTLARGLGGHDDTRVKEQLDSFGDIDCLPRPWEPASCPKGLRAELWTWLDDVAAWINEQYLWDAEQSIPECWPLHPHIAHELPVVACLRVNATLDLIPDKLEDWHRYTLPMFIDRFKPQIHCQPGKHVPWPGISRHDRYTDPTSRDQRTRLFAHDTGAANTP